MTYNLKYDHEEHLLSVLSGKDTSPGSRYHVVGTSLGLLWPTPRWRTKPFQQCIRPQAISTQHQPSSVAFCPRTVDNERCSAGCRFGLQQVAKLPNPSTPPGAICPDPWKRGRRTPAGRAAVVCCPGVLSQEVPLGAIPRKYQMGRGPALGASKVFGRFSLCLSPVPLSRDRRASAGMWVLCCWAWAMCLAGVFC